MSQIPSRLLELLRRWQYPGPWRHLAQLVEEHRREAQGVEEMRQLAAMDPSSEWAKNAVCLQEEHARQVRQHLHVAGAETGELYRLLQQYYPRLLPLWGPELRERDLIDPEERARAVVRLLAEVLALGAPAETGAAVPAAGPAKASSSVMRLVAVYTDGLSDERFTQMARVLDDDTLTTNEKLMKIDALSHIPAKVSAARLGHMLGVTKAAILKTGWWTMHRRGERQEEIERRRHIRRRGADEYEA